MKQIQIETIKILNGIIPFKQRVSLKGLIEVFVAYTKRNA